MGCQTSKSQGSNNSKRNSKTVNQEKEKQTQQPDQVATVAHSPEFDPQKQQMPQDSLTEEQKFELEQYNQKKQEVLNEREEANKLHISRSRYEDYVKYLQANNLQKNSENLKKFFDTNDVQIKRRQTIQNDTLIQTINDKESRRYTVDTQSIPFKKLEHPKSRKKKNSENISTSQECKDSKPMNFQNRLSIKVKKLQDLQNSLQKENEKNQQPNFKEEDENISQDSSSDGSECEIDTFSIKKSPDQIKVPSKAAIQRVSLSVNTNPILQIRRLSQNPDLEEFGNIKTQGKTKRLQSTQALQRRSIFAQN